MQYDSNMDRRGQVKREDSGAFSPEDFMQTDVQQVDPQIILYLDKND